MLFYENLVTIWVCLPFLFFVPPRISIFPLPHLLHSELLSLYLFSLPFCPFQSLQRKNQTGNTLDRILNLKAFIFIVANQVTSSTIDRGISLHLISYVQHRPLLSIYILSTSSLFYYLSYPNILFLSTTTHIPDLLSSYTPYPYFLNIIYNIHFHSFYLFHNLLLLSFLSSLIHYLILYNIIILLFL